MQSNNKVKIGYSEDCIKRLKTFKTGNPDIVLVDTKPGNRYDEATLHKLCKEWHITNEWFKDNENVRKIWNDYNPIKKDFDLLKESVKRYSTVDIGKILNPNHTLLTIPGFNEINEKYKNVENIPEEVKEYLEYALNLMDIYATLSWIKYPLFKLPKNTVWKPEYKIWNNTIKIPYREILIQRLEESAERMRLIKLSVKLDSEILNRCEQNNISEELKEQFFVTTNAISTAIDKEENFVKRLYDALCIIAKFENE